MTPSYADVQQRVESVGLAIRGGFRVTAADELDDIGTNPVRTVIMLGFTGSQQWDAFAASPEWGDGHDDPLDRWSQRVIDALASEFGGRALYPFGGPPWLPFQRWAQRALSLHVSPLGVLLDPRFGLWHSYRGALALTCDMRIPAPAQWPNPCEQCATKPCLHSCPVEAVRPNAYDVGACRSYVRTTPTSCQSVGCLARRACPVGAEHAYQSGQAAFYMRAFAMGARPRAIRSGSFKG